MDPYMANVLVRLERDAMKPAEARARMRKEQMLRDAMVNESNDQNHPVESGNSQQRGSFVVVIGQRFGILKAEAR